MNSFSGPVEERGRLGHSSCRAAGDETRRDVSVSLGQPCLHYGVDFLIARYLFVGFQQMAWSMIGGLLIELRYESNMRRSGSKTARSQSKAIPRAQPRYTSRCTYSGTRLVHFPAGPRLLSSNAITCPISPSSSSTLPSRRRPGRSPPRHPRWAPI